MADHWITTHWPIPADDDTFSRHVYVKERNINCPRPGDIVFVRETIAVRGKLRPLVVRHHQGQKHTVRVAKGCGGLIGGMSVVVCKRRPIMPADVVYDFGDLNEWSLIDCKGFTRFELPLNELLQALGKDPGAGVMFLNLWRVPDRLVLPLLKRIER